MGAGLGGARRGETEAHARLKRTAVVWAQAHGYTACAAEVSLPKCSYRADIAAYRRDREGIGATAIFECKQARADLRKDNCFSAALRERLEALSRRRHILEKHLRIHYPALRISDSLFPEFDSHDFTAIKHGAYTRVVRELSALQRQLCGGTKFETLVRYRCANLFFLVVPRALFREAEVPSGWGALVQRGDELSLMRKPIWHENSSDIRLRLLERIAAAATRHLNRQLEIDFAEVLLARQTI
jgi:hypothetical protein